MLIYHMTGSKIDSASKKRRQNNVEITSKIRRRFHIENMTSKQRRKYDVDPTSKNDVDTTSKLGRFRSRPDFDEVSTSKRRRVPAG